jgi:hypothetical protein
MGKSYPSDVLGREICIGDLKGHANGERQVGEVQIGGWASSTGQCTRRQRSALLRSPTRTCAEAGD